MRKPALIVAIIALFIMVAAGSPAIAKDVPCRALAISSIPHVQGAAATFSTFTDNEDNAGTGNPDNDMGGANPPCVFNYDSIHPIEFNINIGATVPAGMLLTVYAYDVDSPAEADLVEINGHQLGLLTGSNDADSTTSFLVPGSALQPGNNLIQVFVDQYNGDWCAAIYGADLVQTDPIPATSHTGLLILAGLIALAAVAILVKMKL